MHFFKNADELRVPNRLRFRGSAIHAYGRRRSEDPHIIILESNGGSVASFAYRSLYFPGKIPRYPSNNNNNNNNNNNKVNKKPNDGRSPFKYFTISELILNWERPDVLSHES
jgi:hypothetical protein